MIKQAQSYNSLRITNDFLFSKVMRNEKLCRQLLEVILNTQIEHIEYQEEEKWIDITMESKSIRLDVFIKDGKKTVYNIEMQTANPGNLPKRSRYYQGMIDLNLIEKGEDYNQLNKSYVIFICTKDIFGKGRAIYTFENLCLEDTKIHLNDETTKIFLNPVSDMEDVDEELKNFLLYLSKGIISDKFTEELEKEVEKVKKNEEWEVEYMTLHMIKRESYEEGRIEGKIEILINLVKTGLISISIASQKVNMTEEEFIKYMSEE